MYQEYLERVQSLQPSSSTSSKPFSTLSEEKIDESNILGGKRQRKTVDYAALSMEVRKLFFLCFLFSFLFV
jgi:hypothetical protein